RHGSVGLLLPMRPKQRLEHFTADQGAVTGKDKDVPGILAEFVGAHLRGMTGAKLLGLFNPGDARVLLKSGDYLILAVANDDEDAVAPGVVTGLQNVLKHRFAADFMQRLGAPRFHARRFSGGEDDGGCAHGTRLSKSDDK